MKEKILGLHKNVFFLGLVSLFNDFSSQMIQSVMPVFLGVILGVPPLGIGIIEGAADAVASFLKIVSGWLSDKMRRRKNIAVFGYALSVSTRPFLAFAATFAQVFGLRVVDRIGKGVRDAPRDALLAESTSKEELGKSFGYHRAMDALGATLGPLAAFLILPAIYFNYRLLFFIAFGIGLLSIFSFIFVSEKHFDGVRRVQRFNLRLLRENKRFVFYILAIFIFGLGTLPITLMLLHPVEIIASNGGVSFVGIPLAYFIYSGTFVLTAIPLGKISDKLGKRFVISTGFVFAIIAYLGLALSSTFIVALLFFAVFGLYSAATDGVERAIAARLVSDDMLATGEGILNAAVGVSSLLAGLIGGLLWTIFGAQAAFLYGAALSFVGLIAFLIFSFRA